MTTTIDIGRYGYTRQMFVHTNSKALPANGQGACEVGFSSDPHGGGVRQVIPMFDQDAKAYPIGTACVFHYRREDDVGEGMLVGITQDQPGCTRQQKGAVVNQAISQHLQPTHQAALKALALDALINSYEREIE